jgi:predicted deacylase
MKVYKRGEGEPEYTVVGSVHGDEPAGKKAIERFLKEDCEFLEPVQFIIANEEALKENVRYLEADLNRSFPGDQDSEKHEERLAAEIAKLVEDTKVLDLHTTRSYPLPFATFSELNETTRDLLRSAGVKNAGLFPEESGTLHEQSNGIIVETGFQGTEMAAMNALGVLKNFLAAQGVIDGSYGKSDPNIFRHTETVEGDWEFLAENFKLVRKGEVFAKRSGEQLTAEEDFYPILMSTDGYDGMLGFKAEKLE